MIAFRGLFSMSRFNYEVILSKVGKTGRKEELYVKFHDYRFC